MIDVLSLSRIVGASTLQKGLEYSRRGVVFDLDVAENPLRISGRVQGSVAYPYQVDVAVTRNGPAITGLTGICSCPGPVELQTCCRGGYFRAVGAS